MDASVYLKAMDRQRWAFPQVGVAAARVAGGGTRIALAGVAPVPWLLDGPEALDRGDAAAADGLEGRRRPGARAAGAGEHHLTQ